MVRKPIVSGQFYEADSEKLKTQIRECFTSKFGPGSLPGKVKKGLVKGAISPHAGYAFSGPGAAFVYKEMAESKRPDLFIMLGPNHTGLGRTSVLLDDFETPLGIAKVDKVFGKKLIKNSEIDHDSSAHLNEHSIEVQIPFLQFAA